MKRLLATALFVLIATAALAWTHGVTIVVVPPASSISCSLSASYTAPLAANTTLCPISVGPSGWTGTLSLTGANASSFAIVGSNLTVGSSPLSAATYSFNIVATPAGYSQPESVVVMSSSCPITTTLSDGCPGAQANGTIVDAHLADAQQVIDLNIIGGSGYTNGTYSWSSTGGGCSVNAAGTITVSGGKLGGNTRGIPADFTISNEGSGCTSRPTIAVPVGAGAGSGGSIIPTVYQSTPHNVASTGIGHNWNTPGVDYPVGYDTTLTLKDPTSGGTLPSCATYSGHTVTVNSGPCTINGFDFGLHSTHLVVAAGNFNTTITNNSFKCTQGTTTDLDLIHVNAGANGTQTIWYNTFNGGGYVGSACVTGGQNAAIATGVSSSSSGTLDVEYNYCYGEDSKCLYDQMTYTIIEKSNYWADYGAAGGAASHGEAEYQYSGNAAVTQTWTEQFNVMLTHFYINPSASATGGATNLTSEEAMEADDVTLASPNIQWNYLLGRGTQAYTGNNNNVGQISSGPIYCGTQEGGAYSGSPVMANDLVDYSGGFFIANTTSGTCGSHFTPTNVINAGTGNSCTFSTCN